MSKRKPLPDREFDLIKRVIRNTNRLFKSWNKTLRREAQRGNS